MTGMHVISTYWLKRTGSQTSFETITNSSHTNEDIILILSFKNKITCFFRDFFLPSSTLHCMMTHQEPLRVATKFFLILFPLFLPSFLFSSHLPSFHPFLWTRLPLHSFPFPIIWIPMLYRVNYSSIFDLVIIQTKVSFRASVYNELFLLQGNNRRE